ncbi:OLC1v1029989C1 [Oldenlandia corymbosa var. corymbosa]|uniref:OLC1v1029989C1 n=1 Tax=Oldenlandia corymbosa var. corymbosa TaxID=529605 RepID=A0AAV1CGJ9_OLDCO|nr:OLC1v1029989C1 [Oldenlandia corymbosa var. corymbosa]
MEKKPADVHQQENQQQKPKQPRLQRKATNKPAAVEPEPKSNDKNSLIWDCGSSLYDSFELKSFEKQLDSAIHSRSLSMPHLSDRRLHFLDDPKKPPESHHHQPPQVLLPPTSKKSPSKISRSIHRLIRSVFKPKPQQNGDTATFFNGKEKPGSKDGFYFVYEKSGVLSTIPEVPESDSVSPDLKSFVKRTASDRFIFTPVGISCA